MPSIRNNLYVLGRLGIQSGGELVRALPAHRIKATVAVEPMELIVLLAYPDRDFPSDENP